MKAKLTKRGHASNFALMQIYMLKAMVLRIFFTVVASLSHQTDAFPYRQLSLHMP